jgi:hypothetical protein
MQPIIAADQTLNTLIYVPGDGWGWADETLSARLWRCHLQGFIAARWYRAVDALFFWQPNHCYQSWRSEIERRQLPGHYSEINDAIQPDRFDQALRKGWRFNHSTE